MRTQKAAEQLINAVNVLILLMIALIYVVTGTHVGDDAIAALSAGTVYRGRQNGAVALECAVTWNAEALTDMLDILKEKDARITFFVSGKWAKANAATLRRMVEDGHEIGTGGYSPTLDGSVTMVESDIAASVSVIESISDDTTRLYYAGLRDRTTSARAAERLGMTHVSATIDLLCANKNAEDIVSRASQQAFDGSIFLLQPTAAAVEALPQLIDLIHESGYAVGTVGDVLKGTG